MDGAADLGIEGLTATREIGRGGCGVVYEAEQPTFRRKVAVTVLLADTTLRDRDRFEQAALGALCGSPEIGTRFPKPGAAVSPGQVTEILLQANHCR